MIPHGRAQRFGENAQIKTTNPGQMQLSLQCCRMADILQTPCDDHAGKTAQLTCDL
jgi:hypothetical protein